MRLPAATSNSGMLTKWRPAMVMLRCCYASADGAAAAAALAPFRRLAPVATDEVRVVPYAGVLDEGRMPPGMRAKAWRLSVI